LVRFREHSGQEKNVVSTVEEGLDARVCVRVQSLLICNRSLISNSNFVQAQESGIEDAALIKLFEFLIASLFLFLVPDGSCAPPQSDKVRPVWTPCVCRLLSWTRS
jgi:hypothetical protein